jgi:tetratricopeptide (TPR) repeat protein
VRAEPANEARHRRLDALLWKLAKLHMGWGERAEGERYYQKALAVNRAWARAIPGSLAALDNLLQSLEMLADLRERRKDADAAQTFRLEALQVASQILKQLPVSDPRSDKGLSLRRRALRLVQQAGKLPELIQRTEAALKESPKSLPLLRALAEYLDLAGDDEGVGQTYLRILPLQPDAPQRRQPLAAHVRFAEGLAKKQPEKARKAHQTLLKQGDKYLREVPTDDAERSELYTLLSNCGKACAELKERATAIGYYRHAVAIGEARVGADPDNDNARQNYGAALAKWLRKAIDVLQKLKGEGNLTARADQRLLEEHQRDLRACEQAPQALKDLAFARKQAPRQAAADLLSLRASVLARKGNSAAALEAAEALRGLAPKEAENLYDTARCYASVLRAVARGRPRAELSPEGQTLRDLCARRSVEALTAAVQAGFRDGSRLLSDRALDVIRPEPGYREVVQRLDSQAAPK